MQYASGEPSRYTLYLPGGRALPFEDVDVIWWRRPQGFAIHPEVADPDHYAFAQAESTEAFTGLWLAAPVFWINHPTRDSEAGRKAYLAGRIARRPVATASSPTEGVPNAAGVRG